MGYNRRFNKPVAPKLKENAPVEEKVEKERRKRRTNAEIFRDRQKEALNMIEPALPAKARKGRPKILKKDLDDAMDMDSNNEERIIAKEKFSTKELNMYKDLIDTEYKLKLATYNETYFSETQNYYPILKHYGGRTIDLVFVNAIGYSNFPCITCLNHVDDYYKVCNECMEKLTENFDLEFLTFFNLNLFTHKAILPTSEWRRKFTTPLKHQEFLVKIVISGNEMEVLHFKEYGSHAHLYICDFCLNFLFDITSYRRHLIKCSGSVHLLYKSKTANLNLINFKQNDASEMNVQYNNVTGKINENSAADVNFKANTKIQEEILLNEDKPKRRRRKRACLNASDNAVNRKKGRYTSKKNKNENNQDNDILNNNGVNCIQEVDTNDKTTNNLQEIVTFDKITNFHRGKCVYKDITSFTYIYELDGELHPMFCRSLCTIGKFFLDHKTLYFDVDPFLFYVLYVKKRFIGFFSKEKISNFNLSCIVVLPCYQGYGYGHLLIDFSYKLCIAYKTIGTPEKPLSSQGLKAYINYWKKIVYNYMIRKKGNITLEKISFETGMTVDDVVYALELLDFIKKDESNIYKLVVEKRIIKNVDGCKGNCIQP